MMTPDSDRPATPSAAPAEEPADSVMPTAPVGTEHTTAAAPGAEAPASRSFDEARTAARALQFRHRKQWDRWAATDKRPADIPAQPRLAYQDQGWRGWADWLGTTAETEAETGAHPAVDAATAAEPRRRERPGTPGPRRLAGRQFRTFPQARDFARALGLRRRVDWEEWSASGRRPADIPSEPHVVYRNSGWVSWPDWLGKETATMTAARTAPIRHRQRTNAPAAGRRVTATDHMAPPAPPAAGSEQQERARGLGQFTAGVGRGLRVVAARAWGEVEDIWADAQRLRHGGPS